MEICHCIRKYKQLGLGYFKTVHSRRLNCTHKPNLQTINYILNCHYLLAGMYLYLATQSQGYHCLLVSFWTLITVILSDILDFSVF